ncbi:hypothetical protein GH714_035801 [Hevea brasiliensis]|uniref:Hydroxyproline O-arabinosyltransferase-like domain-containing protein n=1 Tax=Hevea brasiliensis TaxID=3981 RepID=A0A6A6KT61_HEVBR|nr:hypothetical protein GH714_035801 [Hevea brasiliensis]
MTGRKNMGRVSPFFLVLLSLGFFFATYNLLTLVIQYKNSSSGNGLELSDSIANMPHEVKRLGKSNLRYHVGLTATDTPYSQWQCRIMYYWYKKMKDMPGSDMGKFTRILHSGKADNLMDEIPTFVVDPLPEGLDRGYIVLNRPWAFVQWLEKATIDEEYILMAEPDHIFVNPLPNLAHGEHPVGTMLTLPTKLSQSILEEISPTWVNISLRMKDDHETDKAFGWVLEMYAYAVASALHGVRHILRKDFMIQPPWDLEVGKRFIIHYTYGCDYNLKGELTYGKIGEWRFDKRSYLSGPPPKNLSLPPPGVPESVVRLVKMVNEATANIPGWESINSS